MTKSLFLTFQPLLPNDGISRKIMNESKSLRNCGFDIDIGYIKYINQKYWLTIDNVKILQYGKSSISWKIGCRLFWRPIAEYIIKHNYEFIYVRYTHFASPATLKLFRHLNKKGIKIFLEIPTYPYDSEYINRTGIIDNLAITMEKIWRDKLGKYVNRIVTFSSDSTIWNCPTISISNGVDIDGIPQWKGTTRKVKTFKMIAVAAFSEWHGYDRLLYGISEYINLNKQSHFDLKAEFIGPHNGICKKLISLSERLGLHSIVSFPGSMSGSELDSRFESSDIAIGSLGRHRSGIKSIRTLKNREYGARAIPFIYSESDPDFDGKDYVFKVPADESPIDIEKLIYFSHNKNLHLDEARIFVEQNLTWNSQMKIIKHEFDNL